TSSRSSSYCYPAPRALHSFPTRRSSDLHLDGDQEQIRPAPAARVGRARGGPAPGPGAAATRVQALQGPLRPAGGPRRRAQSAPRSEEHTSELQSRFDLVCRLLLEKKKKP